MNLEYTFNIPFDNNEPFELDEGIDGIISLPG
jgi:hypothetical protein